MEIAFVLVKCETAHEMDVMRELLKIDGVKEAHGTYGMYDLFLKVVGANHKVVSDIITKQIRKTKNVVSTTTLSTIPEQGGK
ncbi:MAG: Lrp/AsnC family transcriptional regulator [Nitrososphaeria archaeon]|nr:Lrp/AsnC family transcriptional regulator [Nitrososphaeria archaeon]NDB50727.1 Lrp/AsnC family transcriptional regulator [Nitrosopumilaceae archaeon]NDB88625.1 Lrp/AsnC family transcriptional regulator [Nitrososphaerota archaeon]NDB46097.1 Lrp/AsnC family transcriptional regulator [Nitrososphaeria archaeon]NDB63026.1 Lrp/AsnC family transcriptional regulator [Nitrosopumilaceae archaeon]